jgi:hypothetical protein
MSENKYNKIQKERHKQAFKHYCRLGPKRSYRRVAEEMKVSVSTIKNWSRYFDWPRLVEEWDAKYTKKIAERVDEEFADGLERELKLLSLILASGAKDLAEGRSKSTPSNMLKAIETVIRLIEKKRESAESDRKSSTNLPILIMYDNGRGDCTLPRGPLPEAKTNGESDDPEKEDNE